MNRVAFDKLHSTKSHRSFGVNNANEVILNASNFPALSQNVTIDSNDRKSKKSSSSYGPSACLSYSDKLKNSGKEHSSSSQHQDLNICGKKVENKSNKHYTLHSGPNILQGNDNIQNQGDSVNGTVPYLQKCHSRTQVQNAFSKKNISDPSESSIFVAGSKGQASCVKQKKLHSHKELQDNSLSGSSRKSHESNGRIAAVFSHSSTTSTRENLQQNSGREISEPSASNKWQSSQRIKTSLCYIQDKRDGYVCQQDSNLKSHAVAQRHNATMGANLSSKNCTSVGMSKKQHVYATPGAISYESHKKNSSNFPGVEKNVQPSSSTAVTKQFGERMASNFRTSSSGRNDGNWSDIEQKTIFQRNERPHQKKVMTGAMIENSYMPQNTEAKKQKRKKRPSKVKRQTAFQTGKLLILTPELHQRITNQLSENVPRHQPPPKDTFCDINNAADYPELGLSSSVKYMNSKQAVCAQPVSKYEPEKDIKVLTSGEKTADDNFKKLTEEKPGKLEEQNIPLKEKGDVCKKNEEFKVKTCPRDPVQLFEILSTTQTQVKQHKVKTEHTAKVVSTKRSKLNRNLHAPNVLDSSAPVKRGKEREKPKQKRKTPLKKIILLEREQKKNKNADLNKGNGLEASIAEDTEGCKKEECHSEFEKTLCTEQDDCVGNERTSETEMLEENSRHSLYSRVQADDDENHNTPNYSALSLTEAVETSTSSNKNKNAHCFYDRLTGNQSDDSAMTIKFENSHFELNRKFSALCRTEHVSNSCDTDISFHHINDASSCSVIHSCHNGNIAEAVFTSENVNELLMLYANAIAQNILHDCMQLVAKIAVSTEIQNYHPSTDENQDFVCTAHCMKDDDGIDSSPEAIAKLSIVLSSGLKQLYQRCPVNNEILNCNSVSENEIVLSQNNYHQINLSLPKGKCLDTKETLQTTNSEISVKITSELHGNNTAVENMSKNKGIVENQQLGENLSIENTSRVGKDHVPSFKIANYHSKEETENRTHSENNKVTALLYEESPTCIVLEEALNKDEISQSRAVQILLHTKNFREYCNHLLSKELDESVLLFLSDLYRFQDRLYQKDPVKAHVKRRLVYGIKEVTKHLKLKKLKCVIIAPNLENIKAEGGLNDALANLIRLSNEYHIPCIFAADRKQLGKISHKSVPVSSVGIFNYDGSETHFKKIKELMEESTKDYKELSKTLKDCLLPKDVRDLLNAAENAPQTLLTVRTRVLQSIAMQLRIAKNKVGLSNFEKCRQKYIMKI